MATLTIKVQNQAAVAAVRKMMEALPPKEVRRIARGAVKPYADRVEASAPRADGDVYRYNTAKVNSGKRAPRGQGTVVAVYKPGNLGKAMQVLNLRRVGAAVVVGLKRARRPNGVFGEGRADGYYAPFVEYKHKAFVRPAWAATQGVVIGRMIRGLREEIMKNANG